MDALLLLMVLIWGANYSLVKATLTVLPPRAFNAVRMSFASLVFMALVGWLWARGVRRHAGPPDDSPSRPPVSSSSSLVERTLGVSTPSARDWRRILLTALFGHAIYQVAFIEGLGRTTAANAALLIGCSPIVVSLATAIAGHERLSPAHWAGLLLSFAGVYLVVGRTATLDVSALSGDLLMLAAVGCWAIYNVLTRTLLERHSPLFITAWTMTAGTVMFVAAVWPVVMRVDWTAVPAWAWAATLLSGLTALNLAYLIYYVSVQRIGAARTAVWSNVVPLIGMAFAWASLGERIDAWQIGGALLILAGVVFTRLAARRRGRSSEPTPGD
jgi:drug/metabolite transporter (DMT)-like permease